MDTRGVKRAFVPLSPGSKKKFLYACIAVSALVLLLFSLLAARLITNPLGGGARSITPTPTPRNGIGIETVTITENHHSEKINIGIADGQHVQFESPTNSAEVCIDGANPQNNPNNDVPTVIVVTTLSNTSVDKGDSLDIGNEELQGICLWQKDFQKYNHTSEPLRVLVANIGTKETNVLDTTVPLVTGQIIKFAASHPKNFLGVVGFSFSQSVQDAMGTLNANHIPVISPAASSSDFSAEWAYFNRVIPSNQLQGDIAATYAKGVLHATTAFVFLDTKTNPYSKTLGISFINELRSDGSSVTPEYYTVNDPATFDNGINDVLTKYREGSGPAVVFCSCYASDFVALHKWQGKTIPKGLIFMGGEGLYELGSYSGNYTDIYFTAYAYPDTIKILCQGQQESQCTQEQENFLADYCQQFDPQDYKLDTVKLQYCGKYGVSRPGPHVIQTYDAISALQQAYNQAKKTVQAPSKENIQSALNQLSFEGISGQINLTQGDPNNKAILVLCVDSNHLTHLVGVYGQFFQNSSSQPQISLDNVCA